MNTSANYGNSKKINDFQSMTVWRRKNWWDIEGICYFSCKVVSDSIVTIWIVRFLCPWDFSKQEYLSGFSFSSAGDLPNPMTEPVSPTLAGEFFTNEPPVVNPSHH